MIELHTQFDDFEVLTYPNNVTLRNLYTFIVFPTLVYALHYPRTKRIRKGWLLRRVVEMVSISIIVVSMAQQWVLPTVRNAKFDELDVVHIAERVMKLAIPNMYVWLIGFYGFFHLYLNIFGLFLAHIDRSHLHFRRPFFILTMDEGNAPMIQ